MSYQTHYARLTPKFNAKLATPQESLIYQAMPADRLVTFDELYAGFARLCRRDEVPQAKRASVVGLLAALAARGFLKEIHGLRLEKLVESL